MAKQINASDFSGGEGFSIEKITGESLPKSQQCTYGSRAHQKRGGLNHATAIGA
ncbi:MAG: hypothetical protein ACJAWT_001275 [Glaciecola sp.]|jgi:hypothetical protein